MKRLLFFAVALAVSCKDKDAPKAPAVSSAPAATASAAPVWKPKPVIGTDVKAVRCNLGTAAPEADSNVSAARRLHLAPGNKLYYFTDDAGTIELLPSDGGCGYRVGTTLKPKDRFEFGLEPDGSLKEYSIDDETPLRRCRVRAFDKLKYGYGALAFGKYYTHEHNNELHELDLRDPSCKDHDASITGVVASRVNGISSTPGDLLILSTGRSDWKDGNEVLFVDRTGTVVQKLGADEKGKRISNDPWSCGDGLCSTYNQSRFEVFDATGTRKGDYAINSLIKPDLLDNANIANFIDVPGKGVYALVGYNTNKKKARAELIRLDGVY